MNAILSIFRTLFVCMVLSAASYYFINDANKLVLNPIERMLEKVRLIQRNPLAAASDEVQQAGVLSMMANQEEKRQGEPTQEEKQKEREAFLKNQNKANNE